MTAEQAANDLLGLIGVESQAIAGDSTLARICNDLNATIQLLWASVPSWWISSTVGLMVNAPVTLDIGVTAGSKAFTVSGGAYAFWMKGCTARVGGLYNRIAGDGTLLYPWVGGTSTVSASVYADRIQCPADIVSVVPPLFLLGEGELQSLAGNRRQQMDGGIADEFPEIGTPTGYLIEAPDYTSADLVLGIRLQVLPIKAFTISFEGRKKYPAITLPLTTQPIPVPHGFAESVFLPLLRKQFATWKHFNHSGMKTVLDEQAIAAWQIIEHLSPQPSRNRIVRVPCGW